MNGPDIDLKELRQQVAEKKRLEAKLQELYTQQETLEAQTGELERAKLSEQSDVDRLEGRSLAAFFYNVVGKLDQKLDKERQEAYATRRPVNWIPFRRILPAVRIRRPGWRAARSGIRRRCRKRRQ